jgi:hypothetical protein
LRLDVSATPGTLSIDPLWVKRFCGPEPNRARGIIGHGIEPPFATGREGQYGKDEFAGMANAPAIGTFFEEPGNRCCAFGSISDANE